MIGFVFFGLPEGVFLVILCGTRDCIDSALLGIGFVLHEKLIATEFTESTERRKLEKLATN